MHCLSYTLLCTTNCSCLQVNCLLLVSATIYYSQKLIIFKSLEQGFTILVHYIYGMRALYLSGFSRRNRASKIRRFIMRNWLLQLWRLRSPRSTVCKLRPKRTSPIIPVQHKEPGKRPMMHWSQSKGLRTRSTNDQVQEKVASPVQTE